MKTIKMTTKPKPKTHGGKRAGAGRPPNPPILSDLPGNDDPMEFLREVMNDASQDMRLRADAAKALMPFLHQKKGEGGKKDEQATAAQKVANGKFAPSAPPIKLVR